MLPYTALDGLAAMRVSYDLTDEGAPGSTVALGRSFGKTLPATAFAKGMMVGVLLLVGTILT